MADQNKPGEEVDPPVPDKPDKEPADKPVASTPSDDDTKPPKTDPGPSPMDKAKDEAKKDEKAFDGLDGRSIINNYYFSGENTSGIFGNNGNFTANQSGNTGKPSQSASDKKRNVKLGQIKTKEKAQEWFSDKQASEQTFILALVFFYGFPLRFVLGASEKLKAITVPSKKSDSKEEKSSIFGSEPTIDHLLAESFAETADASINTKTGKSSYQVVVFLDAKFFSLVTDMIRSGRNFVQIYPKLRTWLLELSNADHQTLVSLGALNTEIVRTQAALGIGFLAQREFTETLNSIVDEWAVSDDPYDRIAVGWALVGYLRPDDEESLQAHWPNVSSLIKHWSSLDNYRLQWTAVATTTRLALLASDQRPVYLTTSLAAIKTVCQSKTSVLFKAVVSKSLQIIFALSPYHAETVCLELGDWLKDSEHPQLADFAAEFFMALANKKIDTQNNADDQSKTILIWNLCDPYSDLFDATYRLMQQAFLHRKGSFIDFAIDQMVNWVTAMSAYPNGKGEDNLLFIFKKLHQRSAASKYISLVLKDKRIKNFNFQQILIR